MMQERNEEYARTKTKRDLAMWAASFVLSLAQWYDVVFFFGNDLLNIFQAEQGVLDGYPHWRLVQSRVLDPWLEKFLTLLFGFKLSLAHAIVAIAVLTVCGVVMVAEFGQTVIVIGLPRPTQQSSSPALRQVIGNEFAVPTLAA
jgi:hypothetical protein